MTEPAAPKPADDGDFNRLWAGQTVSVMGSQVSGVAMPLIAAILLKATPAQMGFLVAIPFLPNLLVGLPAGAWVERVRKRPVLISGDLMRALLVGMIPVLSLLGVLRIEHLYVMALLGGTIGVFFDVASTALLPALVARERLVVANGRLQSSRAVAQIAGPSLGGLLVALLTAPVAVTVDAVSFLVSALLTTSIRRREPAPAASAHASGLWADVGEGMRFVFREPILRPALGWVASINLCMAVLMAEYVLYLTRVLGFGPRLVGLSLTSLGVGSIIGATFAQRLARRIGVGGSILGAALLAGVAGLLLTAVTAPLPAAAAGQVSALILFGLGTTIANVNLISLFQAVAPPRLLARTIATIRFVTWGVIPAGALAGGALATRFGIRPTLFAAMVGVLLSAGWVLFSRLRSLAEVPPQAEDPEEAPSSSVAAALAEEALEPAV
ncbi:MAG: transporter [Gemmatimonadetes bacterium]|nr:transporter [Gemmatimonadota bacterium]